MSDENKGIVFSVAQFGKLPDIRLLGGSSISVAEGTQRLLKIMEGKIDMTMLAEALKMGDYNGMDVDEIIKKLTKACNEHPKDVLIILSFGVKNGGTMSTENLDKYSGTDLIRTAVNNLQVYIKPKGSKSQANKSAITISRIMMFLHPICVDMVIKLKLPPAAGVEFPVSSALFKSTFAPYMYYEKADPSKIVYDAMLEWAMAHHDQVNPAKDGVKPKFNKTIFELKLKSSSMDEARRAGFTAGVKSDLDLMDYKPGSTYQKIWELNGLVVGKTAHKGKAATVAPTIVV